MRALWALPLLCAAACTAVAAGPVRGTPPAGNGGGISFETILQRSIPGQSGPQRREAVRDTAAWQALWSELRAGTELPETPPAVDFTKDMVIAAALETQPCVAKVTVRSIQKTADGLSVDLLEAPPAPNCRCIVAERPLHLVRLARQDGPVRFTAERVATPCGGR